MRLLAARLGPERVAAEPEAVGELIGRCGGLPLAGLLADFGDAYQSAGDLPAARQARQQALQILGDLRLPDHLGVREKLAQAGAPSPQG